MNISKLQTDAKQEFIVVLDTYNCLIEGDDADYKQGREYLNQFLSDQIQKAYSKGREEMEKKYSELIMAVENKYEGETRHQTALRYIKKGTTGSGGNACKSPLSIQSKGK
jgi:hypothetical protein